MNKELERELDSVMDGLNEFCRSGDATGTRMTKAIDAGDAEDDGDAFPSTVEGLAQYAQSADMRDLLRRDPAAFRTKYLDFVLGHELVAKGLVTAQQVSAWSHQLSQLPGRRTQGELGKAVMHAENTPRPWEFELTPRGLEGFINSVEMQALERARPALYRQLYMDFFTSMEPLPTPIEVGVKRQELELIYPDNPAASVVAKAARAGGRITSGQSVLVSNFGAALGDPAVWLRP